MFLRSCAFRTSWLRVPKRRSSSLQTQVCCRADSHQLWVLMVSMLLTSNSTSQVGSPVLAVHMFQAGPSQRAGWGLAGVPNAESLFRVLRLAVHYGFVAGGDDKATGKVVFWNNAVSSALREDHPNSVRCVARFPDLVMLAHCAHLGITSERHDWT